MKNVVLTTLLAFCCETGGKLPINVQKRNNFIFRWKSKLFIETFHWTRRLHFKQPGWKIFNTTTKNVHSLSKIERENRI